MSNNLSKVTIVSVKKRCPGKGKSPIKITYDPSERTGKLSKAKGYRGSSKKPRTKRGICPVCAKEVALTVKTEVIQHHSSVTGADGNIKKDKKTGMNKLAYTLTLDSELVARISIIAKKLDIPVNEFILYTLNEKVEEYQEEFNPLNEIRKSLKDVKRN